LLSEQRAGGCQNKARNRNGPHTMNAFQTMWLYYRPGRDKVNQQSCLMQDEPEGGPISNAE
jgi:hypothetical protein